jgi:3-hydroxy-3-methylglutaryl CoA synthase
MVGIVSYGSYVPYRRLKRAAIAQVLGGPSDKGERAVASFDEDSVSMAVEATRDALRSAPATSIDALFFATTTPPYADKLNAALVGAAATLAPEMRASDCTGSVRAGLSALLQGVDSVRAGARQALVAIGDARLAAPEAKAERANGDGAVAFVLGSEGVVAEVVASVSFTKEFLDTWREPDERFPHTWEERFALTQAYAPLLAKAVQGARQGRPSRRIWRRSCSTVRTHARPRTSRAGSSSRQLADPAGITVGQTGPRARAATPAVAAGRSHPRPDPTCRRAVLA